MPRKPLCRRIRSYPDFWSFSPDEPADSETIILSLDEYETIRLIDHEGMTQEQCGKRMGVARTTVTAIYDSARKKLSQVIVDGKNDTVKNNYVEIREQGRKVANALKKAKFEGAKEAQKLAESIVSVASGELEAFEKGCSRLGAEEQKNMTWARALMLGKKAAEPEKDAEPEIEKAALDALPGAEFRRSPHLGTGLRIRMLDEPPRTHQDYGNAGRFRCG